MYQAQEITRDTHTGQILIRTSCGHSHKSVGKALQCVLKIREKMGGCASSKMICVGRIDGRRLSTGEIAHAWDALIAKRKSEVTNPYYNPPTQAESATMEKQRDQRAKKQAAFDARRTEKRANRLKMLVEA